MKKLIIYSHPDCLLKFNGSGHPERKERISTIINSINNFNNNNIEFREIFDANIEFIKLVHPENYIKKMFELIPKKNLLPLYSDTFINPNTNENKEPIADTFLCPNSESAILKSSGAGITASDCLMNNNIFRFFCVIRPPGHHAETIRANGFCFFNNIAITAKYLQFKYSVKKIAIIDFDVHHCNGTQEIFYHDPNILCASIHQYPLFPGTGSIDQIGVGNIFNVPINSNTDSKSYLKIFENKIIKNVDKFKPEIILISAGFDAHKRDPLANINLESEDYYSITKQIVNIANIHSNGRIISFLEGGYDLKALYESSIEHIKALCEQ